MTRPLLVALVLLTSACGPKDDTDDTDLSTDVDTSADTDASTDADSDTDTAVDVPDFDPESSLGQALIARCATGVDCGDAYTCSGPVWDSEESCYAELFDVYSEYDDDQLVRTAAYFDTVSCGAIFESSFGWCNNPDYTDQCDCPANPCEGVLDVPSTADVVVDVTVAVQGWQDVASIYQHTDYAFGVAMPEYGPGDEVAIRLGFTDALAKAPPIPGGAGQSPANGILVFNPMGGTPSYTWSNPTLELGPDTSTFANNTVDGSSAEVTVQSGDLQCALLTFEVPDGAGDPVSGQQMNVFWRSASGWGPLYEPPLPGFRIDGDFRRP